MQKYALSSPSQRRQVELALRAIPGWTERPEQSCQYRLDFAAGGERVAVKQYTNGTLLVQPAGDGGILLQHIRAALEGIAPASGRPVGAPAKVARPGEADVAHPFALPWIGSDESGKGDYFGPLVACAVYVDERTAALLETLGVRDSKQLSDAQNRRLAGDVRAITGDQRAEVVIPPDRYNDLYEQFRGEGKNLNALLAWGHVRAIGDVLDRVPCRHIIVDQFADARYVESRLGARLRDLTLVQVPRAEANVAVAAASVLARDRFLGWLEQASADLGVALPKGAAPQVEATGRRLVAARGADVLRRIAKLHFKTTERVLARPLASE